MERTNFCPASIPLHERAGARVDQLEEEEHDDHEHQQSRNSVRQEMIDSVAERGPAFGRMLEHAGQELANRRVSNFGFAGGYPKTGLCQTLPRLGHDARSDSRHSLRRATFPRVHSRPTANVRQDTREQPCRSGSVSSRESSAAFFVELRRKEGRAARSGRFCRLSQSPDGHPRCRSADAPRSARREFPSVG